MPEEPEIVPPIVIMEPEPPELGGDEVITPPSGGEPSYPTPGAPAEPGEDVG
ncbi:hypothetical protein ACQEVG_32695 [Streptomyces sp. CA-135486]|uniref:hypothetical protein n=1 Tax=Streptomyces sp. CA-135486 TaxID=3240049 RepID=UPI003D911E28